MELKHRRWNVRRLHVLPLNRTIWELKRGQSYSMKQSFFTLNRTILELKHENITITPSKGLRFKSYHFGIETQIHRSGFYGRLFFKSYHFGIETWKLTKTKKFTIFFKSYHFGIET